MGGLIDTNTGLHFGEGLIWMNPIGGGGLTIVTTGPTPPGNMITEASDNMITEDGNQMITETA